MRSFIFIVVICSVNALTFNDWTIIHQKKYNSVNEKIHRQKIWESNNLYIQKQNTLDLDFQLEMNKYGDLTFTEFVNTHTGFKQNMRILKNYKTNFDISLPKHVNWTEKGVVTEVKNQYQCGSCWAFSTTGAVESMHAIKTGKLISLSEENLIDCTFDYGNLGCSGGLPSQALDYIIANKGIDTEESYPLFSVTMFDCMIQEMCPCYFNRSTVGATIDGYNHIISGNETNLQYVLASTGPVSVAIDATQSLQFYKSGVFSDTNCSSSDLNHAVLAVGYGSTNNGQEYYIVKNSWGIDWGSNGYFLLARNQKNMCGIATEAVYPYLFF
ncbi:cathepsin Llike cysteine protease [Tupanvirus deep ocean]|uniref:Cathepsin Llike cysteine protease n=1 Tax=Tupanvirus soda lake TaxID=2126985 RepID=A0A2K9L2Z9_9VIRU|nr:cathepsin Llike cysteine protease [Tupanvirus deep ocean]AUL79879.2 cathepsin Llike cysteine protease [Tupanvirus deep ocean]